MSLGADMGKKYRLVILFVTLAMQLAHMPFASAAELSEAQQVFEALARAESVAVVLPPSPKSNDRTAYETVTTREAGLCLKSVARESGIMESEIYSGLLALDLDPRNAPITAAAKRHQLTLDDALFVQNYTKNVYTPINEALRQKMTKRYACFIEGLKSALRKFPEYIGIVMRGTGMPEKILAEHVPGQIVTYRSFTSTTAGTDVHPNFRHSPVILTIHSRHGRDIRSFNEEEGEILFLPDSRFLVVAREGGGGPLATTRITLQEIE